MSDNNEIRATARNGDVHLRFPGRIYVMSPSDARALIFALAVAASEAAAQSGTYPEHNQGGASGGGRKHE